ncbi:EAL domain-containing protein [Ferrimonas pelagia]
MGKWIATLILLMLPLWSIAQPDPKPLQPNYPFRHFDQQEGLTEGTITSIAQDGDGFIWVGTLNGLNRFDGHRFKHYQASPSQLHGLKENMIVDLLLDSEHQLWVITNANLYRFDPVNNRFVAPFELNDHFWSASQNATQLILSGHRGFYVIEDEQVTFHDISSIDNEGYLALPGLDTDSYLISTFDGRNYLKLAQDPTFQPTLSHTGKINAVQPIDGKHALIASNLGLFVAQTASSGQLQGQQLRTPPLIAGLRYQPDSRELYLASLEGLYTGKLTEDLRLEALKPVSATPTTEILLDSNAALWAGTVGQGLHHYSPKIRQIKTYPLSNTATAENQVWSAFEQNGTVWVANNTGTVQRFNQSMQPLEPLDVALTGPKSLSPSADGLYVAGANGLRHYHAQTQDFTALIADRIVTSLTPTPDGLFAGTYSGDVFHIDSEHHVRLLPLMDTLSSTIFNVTQVGATLYVGAQSGLLIYQTQDGEERWQKTHHLLSDKVVTSIGVLHDSLLIGTASDGLYHLEQDQQLSRLETQGITESPAIYTINITQDHIYLSASNGIIKLSKDTLNLLDHYLPFDGVQKSYNAMASFTSSDKIFFGGSEGLTILTATDSAEPVHDAKPIITAIKVFNQDYRPPMGDPLSPSLLERIVLSYSEYPFSFTFVDLASRQDTSLRYQYRLQGFSDQWLTADNDHRVATFTNVPHGQYTFEVRTQSVFAHTRPGHTRIEVLITPPWWLSTQAKLLYALLLLLTAGLSYREYQRRREVQQRIAQSEERLKLALWGSGDEMWDWDIPAGKVHRSNSWQILSVEGQQGRTTHPDDKQRVHQLLMAHFEGKSEHFEATYRVKTSEDDWLWVLDRAKIVERDEHNTPLRMTGTIKNINQLKRSEERLSLFARALTNISEGMYILNAQREYIELNNAFLKITEQQRTDLLANPIHFNEYPDSYVSNIFTIVDKQGQWSGEIDHCKHNGHRIQLEIRIDRIDDIPEGDCFYVGVVNDITHRKAAEQELRRLVNNDSLTGLPNRNYLQISLDKLIRLQIPFCLFLFDLDDFKRVNDSLGHESGDALLCHIANRLRARLPDEATLHRLGGDEFAVVYEGELALPASTLVAQTLLEGFEHPYSLEHNELLIHSSIGIANYPEDDDDRQSLLRKADLAMYHAKSLGGQCYQYYNDNMNKAAQERLSGERLLREALKKDWFEVHYQAKVDTHNHNIVGAEALVRIKHPQHGLIPPSQFIPLAEESSLIIEIGELVLKQACATVQGWHQQGLFSGRIAVNLASKQFTQPDLVERITEILQTTQLPATQLELEITEGTVIQKPEDAVITMRALRRLGISLALDDFGTGYSSLSYLKSFPLDTLKIDKSFIDDLIYSHSELMMVSSLITIAKNLGLTTVAEGVEVKEQARHLQNLSCDMIQGFLFSKPLTSSEFETLLRSEQHRLKRKSQESV